MEIILFTSPIERVVKVIFVTRDRPFFFPVKCEMANFFLVNRDFHSSREVWFCKIIFRETRNKCLVRHKLWFSLCLCYFRQPLLRNKWSWLWQDGWSLWRQRGWSGFQWPLASQHFYPLFFYFDHNGRSTSTQCPRWPRSSTRTTSLHGFTKCDCVNKFFF